MKTKGIYKFGASASAYIFDYFNSFDTDTIVKHEKGVTFKVLRSPSRKEQSGGFNNNLIFNDLVFKTPNELFAYILEEYFGFEVELVKGYSHKKKSVTITGIK